MEELIVSLLKESGRVIIPDFGAFIVKTKSPLKVIFNEFLQYNDGALIGATSKKFNIERDAAAKKVKDYATEITSKLDSGTSIDLPEIGSLSKSSTGKITFGTSDATTAETAPKEEDKKAEGNTVEFDVSDNKETPKTSVKPKPAPAAKPANKPEAKAAEKPAEKAPSKPTPPPTPKPTPVSKPTAPTTKNPEKPTPNSKETTPIAEYYDEEPSRNKVKLILWIVLIVLVNGAIVGYFIYDEEIKALFQKNNEASLEQVIDTPLILNEEEDIPIVDETITTENDTELIIEPAIEEQVETETPSATISGTKYYVVAGVFKEETNANNLVIKLNNDGYNAEKFGKIGAMHAVSYDVFPNKQEADRFMLKIKREVDAEAWIRAVD